ncbi:TPA: thioredoxin-disulfide reductase [Candidatus Falkowbacteria bacterium]|nr:MAG: Pyridine nucleotide-disulfide oxidoreductase, FAD/NAD(P)-binding domain-containing protein [Candidatus Falkowbacteria bacterium GW2011_GWF2_43_32]HBA37068.1 thioredoxin-disulfide reductase [Candidatus Falkowbacteria bacterium]
MYDLIIIGAGPAGMTAGIFATRREMKTLIIGREVGGQLVWASEIENYPGFLTIDSLDLINKMKEQATTFGVELKEDEVQKIQKTEYNSFLVYTGREKFEAKTVVIAMGLSPRRLSIPGETELNGRGVSYCANCDGPLFRGKTIAVVGGGNSALDAAEMMSKIAKEVYLIHRSDSFKAFDVLVDEVKNRPNIKILMNTEVKSIGGEGKVEKIKIMDKQTSEEKDIVLDGVFVEVGRLASTELVAGLVERDAKQQIIITNKGETKTPGLFAAGDVTNCEFKQIPIAMGEATTAALSAYQYLQSKQGGTFVAKDY